MDVLICSRTKSIFTLFQVLTVSVFCLYDKSCTTCLLISKSFKELFFMAFFRKADAKVRQIFEPPKLFEVFFETFLFQSGSSSLRPFVQYFNSSAFLSRKRMQNYCFTTYLPNLCNHFFQTFCKLFANSLICRCVLQQGFSAALQGRFMPHLNIITRTRIRIYISHASRTFHPIHLSMKWTVNHSFFRPR